MSGIISQRTRSLLSFLSAADAVVSYVHTHAEFILSDRICICDFGAATLTRMEVNPEHP